MPSDRFFTKGPRMIYFLSCVFENAFLWHAHSNSDLHEYRVLGLHLFSIHIAGSMVNVTPLFPDI